MMRMVCGARRCDAGGVITAMQTVLSRARILCVSMVGLSAGGCSGEPGTPDGDDTDAGQTAGSETSAESGDAVDGSTDDGPEVTRPNWHEDIALVIAQRCRSCHDGEGIAFPMTDYADTRPYAEVMALQTEAGTMPPWHAIETEECEPEYAFENDARLNAEEIALFADWAAAGSPEGDPALAVPLPAPADTDLPGASSITTMGGSLTIEQQGEKLDFFHCLSFDPGHEQDVYLDGMQVMPGNPKVVHHVLMYVDAGGESAAWQDGILRDCDGGSGVAGATLVGAWVPGALPIETPQDVGVTLPVGARIVYNVHYHVDPGAAQVDDSTGLSLRWSTEVPPWVSEFRILGEPGLGTSTTGAFSIAAGAVGHVEEVRWTIPAGTPPLRVWAFGNHMHRVGVDMKTDVIRAGGETECLVHTPNWDYNWQRLYEIDAPIEDTILAEPGDTVRLRCTYDNSLANPGVAQALNEVGLDEPQVVVAGDGTLDEMCVAGIGFAVEM